jgi:hypothetical protein
MTVTVEKHLATSDDRGVWHATAYFVGSDDKILRHPRQPKMPAVVSQYGWSIEEAVSRRDADIARMEEWFSTSPHAPE